MNHVALKGIAIVCLFVLTSVAGILPLKISSGRLGVNGFRQAILSCCNCFAGGVFLATCLLDLLPMIREKFAQAFSLAHITTVFPVAEFTTCVGFFIVLIIEQIVHSVHEAPFLHGDHNHDSQKPLLEGPSTSVDVGTEYTNTDSFAAPSTADGSSYQSHRRNRDKSGLRTYILILALSMHSVFEGLALGLIADMDRLVEIASAIVIHKSIIAFSLGVNLVQHELPTSTVIKAVLLFSVMGPIGIGLGLMVLQSSSLLSSSLASGILQGIACGTFLFVTFFEIFQKELSEMSRRLVKVLFMLLGFCVVTGLLYYANILEHKTHAVKNPQATNSSIVNFL